MGKRVKKRNKRKKIMKACPLCDYETTGALRERKRMMELHYDTRIPFHCPGIPSNFGDDIL